MGRRGTSNAPYLPILLIILTRFVTRWCVNAIFGILFPRIEHVRLDTAEFKRFNHDSIEF